MSKFAYLTRFVEETPFHGYGLAGRAFNWYEFATWLLMIIVCSIMTIVQAVQLIQLYQTEPTNTIVTVAENSSIIFDNSVLCFEINNNFAISTDTTAIKAWLDTANISALGGPDSLPDFHPELVYLISEMIFEITAIEYGLLEKFWGRKVNGNVTLASNAALNLVYTYLIGKRIKYIPLLKNIGSLACRLFNVTATKFQFQSGLRRMTKEIIDICIPDNIVSFSVNGLCVRVRGKNNSFPSFATPYDYLLITSNPENFHRQVDRSMLETLSVRLDLLGRLTRGLEVGGTCVNKYFNEITLASELEAQYQLYDLRRRPCSNGVNNPTCHSNCLAQNYYSLCGCWPLAYFYSAANQDVPLCTEKSQPKPNATAFYTIPDYSECLSREKLAASTPMVMACHDKCRPDCSYMKFTFVPRVLVTTNGPSQIAINIKKNSTIIQLQVADLVYPLFKESLAKNWETFLSEFGGTIGLWLGGSIIAIFHVPMFIGKIVLSLMVGWNKKRKAPVAPNNLY